MNIDEAVGRTVQVSLVKGEPILLARLADEKRGRGLAAILPKGMRAMSVGVNRVIGVSGHVQPGDYVDVIVTMRPDDESARKLAIKASAMAKVILQNIKVLAVGEHLTTKGNKAVKVPAVTLEVNPEQSERLALASRHGGIVLTMRSRIDQDEVPTAGITPVALLAPDEGSEEATVVARAGTGTPAPKRRSSRRRAKKQEEKKPEPPVVEVLRGGSIVTRKLRPSADSQ
jgi:pilus assembly protein CpaB